MVLILTQDYITVSPHTIKLFHLFIFVHFYAGPSVFNLQKAFAL